MTQDAASLGALFRGGVSVRNERRKDDFYPTPLPATAAFLAAEKPFLDDYASDPSFGVYEPACGEGHMARMIEGAGYRVWATDLVDRGYGDGVVDFMMVDYLPFRTTAIITNPPYGLWPKRFINHALGRLRAPYAALLLKADYFNSIQGLRLLTAHPLAAVYPLSWRLDFLDQGRPVMNCTWFVWDSRRSPLPYHVLPHPDVAAQGGLL